MNIFPPDLPKQLAEGVDFLDKLSREDRLEEAVYTGQNFCGENLKNLEAVRCRFIKCDFSEANLAFAGFRDVVFEACDFSNSDLNKASFQRVVFAHCKLMGMDFVEGSMHHARFTECDARYLNVADSKVQNVAFESTRLENASFLRCRMKAQFSHCNLTQTMFEQTPLKEFDLRTCRLEGVQVTPSDLRGAIVTPLQASELAVLLGLIIKEQEE